MSVYSKPFGLVVIKVILMTISQCAEGFIHSLLTELTQSFFMERRSISNVYTEIVIIVFSYKVFMLQR